MQRRRRHSGVHAEYTFWGRRLKPVPRASICAVWSRHGPDGPRTLWLPQAGGEEREAMNTSVRARRGSRGFSFVELLVTMVIAGIAFAALVPVFVSAQQKSAGDTARNVALNLAQDRVEKVRQLDYDLITESNLDSVSFQGGQFGTVAHVEGGHGTKDYNLAYSVVFVGGTKNGLHAVNYTSGDRTENYKMVTVDAYWTGNPHPVKHAVLQTYVYKQYAGSFINTLAVSPVAGNIDRVDATRQFVTSYSITLTAYLNEADAQNTAEVTFWVYSS